VRCIQNMDHWAGFLFVLLRIVGVIWNSKTWKFVTLCLSVWSIWYQIFLSPPSNLLMLSDNFNTCLVLSCMQQLFVSIIPLGTFMIASKVAVSISNVNESPYGVEIVAGGPSNTLPVLSWTARLKIAQGTARGLMYIHEHSPRKYVHGNLKSTKILLDDELQPYISSFGLTRLVWNSSKFATSASKKQYLNQTISSAMGLKISAPSNIYLAPEARVPGSKFSQKCDVYSFGIVLMELLTGRLPGAGSENDGEGLESLVRKVFQEERPLSEIIDPALLSEVHAKKQVIAVFHISLNCTELDPELRPRMRTVSESLDRIKLH